MGFFVYNMLDKCLVMNDEYGLKFLIDLKNKF